MRKVLIFIAGMFLAMVFTGCGGPVTLPNGQKSNDLGIVDMGNGTYRLNTNFLYTRTRDIKKSITMRISEIGDFVKIKNFQYFAIINPEVNNLTGFPITTINNLYRYCYPSLETETKMYSPKCGMVSGYIGKGFNDVSKNGETSIDFVMFKERPENVFVWDVKNYYY